MTGTQQRAVVVGCQVGRMHADAYSHSDATELVALCDLDEQALHNVADAHDVDARYTDFETMLREQQPGRPRRHDHPGRYRVHPQGHPL